MDQPSTVLGSSSDCNRSSATPLLMNCNWPFGADGQYAGGCFTADLAGQAH